MSQTQDLVLFFRQIVFNCLSSERETHDPIELMEVDAVQLLSTKGESDTVVTPSTTRVHSSPVCYSCLVYYWCVFFSWKFSHQRSCRAPQRQWRRDADRSLRCALWPHEPARGAQLGSSLTNGLKLNFLFSVFTQDVCLMKLCISRVAFQAIKLVFEKREQMKNYL